VLESFSVKIAAGLPAVVTIKQSIIASVSGAVFCIYLTGGEVWGVKSPISDKGGPDATIGVVAVENSHQSGKSLTDR